MNLVLLPRSTSRSWRKIRHKADPARGAAILGALLVAGASALGQQTTERVSVDSVGNQANGESSVPSSSSDGRYVAFESTASSLVAGDTNGVMDVFVHDTLTGATERVSVDPLGSQANSDSSGAAISGDGRCVAFQSTASVCNGSFSQDLNARWCPTCPKPHHAPEPGKKLQIQFWYRDPLNTSNQTTSLSDAIEVGVCP